MSLSTSSRPFPLRVTRTVTRVVGAMAMAAVFTACASPTAPEVADDQAAAPRRNVMCVGAGANSQVVVVSPSNGACPVGFDLQPWW